MHRCASCVISVDDAQKYRQVRTESNRVLVALAAEQAWDGTEPAFQLLVLPVKSEEQLPVYDSRPEYLSPAHCRLCLAEFEGQGAAVVDGVADEPVVEGARANVGASVVAGALDGGEAGSCAGDFADGVNAETSASCLAEFEGQGAAVVDGVADESVEEGARANVGASVVGVALCGGETGPCAGESADGVDTAAFAHGSVAPEEDPEASTLLKFRLRVEHELRGIPS